MSDFLIYPVYIHDNMKELNRYINLLPSNTTFRRNYDVFEWNGSFDPPEPVCAGFTEIANHFSRRIHLLISHRLSYNSI